MNLKDLNIGDSVTVIYLGRVSRIEKIEIKTKTMLITNTNSRYNINTGYSIPHEFISNSIRPTTEEDLKVIRRQKMIDKLMGFSFHKLSDEQLENVMKAISGEVIK